MAPWRRNWRAASGLCTVATRQSRCRRAHIPFGHTLYTPGLGLLVARETGLNVYAESLLGWISVSGGVGEDAEIAVKAAKAVVEH